LDATLDTLNLLELNLIKHSCNKTPRSIKSANDMKLHPNVLNVLGNFYNKFKFWKNVTAFAIKKVLPVKA